ncbi:UvrD-helicase domain-containing protein, partial [Sphingomonas sp.]|uniref:UvrD-helicase domain-containing protein n=1 Tax=Sphingomonas sp. TaxID=28214 RepID=UPI0025D9CD19
MTPGLPPLKGDQAPASAPAAHIWLAASAGTGKTQVLAARVYRLLLRGTDPAAILCLTFTKAGAAEMSGRIARQLARWVRMSDADLKKDLFALGEDPNDARLRARARTLFARLLDAPGGGIRVQTIHGFCQGLLAGFPLEAGLVPGFRPVEGREEAVLARETLAALLVEAERSNPALIDAIGALSLRLGEGGAEEFLHACAAAHDALAALPSGIQPDLRRAFDLPAGDVEEAIIADCADDRFDIAGLKRIAAANRAWGTKTGVEAADLAQAWLDARPAGRAAMLDALKAIGFKKDDTPRSFSAKVIAAEPDYAELAVAIAERCLALTGLRARAAYADLLARALSAGRAYAHAYATAKRQRGLVDFNDLIGATVRLLQTPGMGQWVRYKLDLETQHILVDEAQDTNLDQWRIVLAIAEEFFAGDGTATGRTLFVVGDYKQAIFGFQGTDPKFFAWAEREVGRRAAAGHDPETGEGTPFRQLSLTTSFRSTQPVLDFVDAALAHLPAPGLGIDEVPAHASAGGGPGAVELWPPARGGGAGDDEETWIDDHIRANAGRIARTIKAWLDPANPLMLQSKGRPLTPGDVMVLVKRRGELAALIVAKLYAEGVPVAGVDRLRLNAPLAVQDLLAALRFALQPEDDLTLATLLVSPLIGWGQDELLAAAAPRETGLWRHLRATQPEEKLAPLYDLLARADFSTPYQLLEHLLSGPLDGRRRLLRRLGTEARDPVDELLAAALDFEALATPSLQAFVDWFDRGEVEIKRDAGEAGDAVRVMTAHGAKGLQAPLVILADACVDPGTSPRTLLHWEREVGGGRIPIIRPKKDELGGPLAELVAAQRDADLAEHWRLFYVAATRAEERLVIAGSLGPRAKEGAPKDSWHAAADRAFAALGVVGEGERVFTGRVPGKPLPRRDVAPVAEPLPPVPGWARRPAP